MKKLDLLKPVFSYDTFINELKVIIARYRFNRVRTLKEKGYAYYMGSVSMLHPIQGLKPGNVVITPRGIGYVHTDFPLNSPKASRKYVEVWLKKRYYKAFKIEEVYQYYVYHALFDTYIPVLPSCYQYLILNGETIEYRITDRGFADLSPEEKNKRAYIPIFSAKRGGRTLLRELIRKGYIISK